MVFTENYCFQHTNVKSSAICAGCGKHLCRDCARFSSGRTLCGGCESSQKAAARGYSDRMRFAPKVIKKRDYAKTILKYGFRLAVLSSLVYIFMNLSGVLSAAVRNIPALDQPKALSTISNVLKSLNYGGDPEKFKKMLSEISGSLVVVQMNMFLGPIETNYRIDGTYPNNFETYLKENFESPDKKKDVSKDIWGTTYRLEIRPDGFAIHSAGMDKQFGTVDDLICPYKRRIQDDQSTR